MKSWCIRCWFAVHLFLVGAGPTAAQGRVSAARETAQYVLQHFSGPAFRMEAAMLASKIEAYAARHGSGFLQAVRRVGPRAFTLVEEAGVNSKQVVNILAKYGEHGATWVVGRPQGMRLLLQHGEGAAAVLVKHKGIAAPVLEGLGAPAIRALQATNAQGGRRLAMMVESGELAKIGRTQDVLDVIGRYGNGAMNFVWENKGALATTAGLTAFLANPEPFITGAQDLAHVVGDVAVKPLMQIPSAAVEGVARGTNWTVIFLAAGLAAMCLWLVRHGYLTRWLGHTPQRPAEEETKTSTADNGAPPGEATKR